MASSLLLGLSLTACSKKQEGTSAGASSTPAPPAPPPAVLAAIPASAMPPIPLPPAAGPLTGKLQQEAASRPNAPIKPEAVFALVQQKGVELHEIQQYMGSTGGAKYCAGAKTPNDAVFLTVCEFDDASAAQQGKAKSEQDFASIPLRQLVVNRTSLLMVRDLANTPESAGQAKLLATTFASL